MNDCTELKVNVLNNQEALCWFDSATFALFHKERPELETFFATYETPPFTLMKSLYEHFTNKTPLTKLREKVDDFRTNEGIKDIFNLVTKSKFIVLKDISGILIEESKPPQSEQTIYTLEKTKEFDAYNTNNAEVQKTIKLNETDFVIKFKLNISDLLTNGSIIEKEKGKVTFDIETTQGDDPGNFFNGVLKFSSFETVQKNGKPENSYYAKLANEISLFDLNLLNDEKSSFQNTYTLIINRQGEKNSIIPSNFLETIVLPIDGKTTEYSLDAVIVHTGGYHYVVFVRCGSSENWVFYNDANAKEEQPIDKANVINSFEEMRNFNLPGYTNVIPNTHFQYLFYSRNK
jgi:hypothetical protein